MKLTDIEKLYRFENEVLPIHLLRFKEFGQGIYQQIKNQGLLHTMYLLPEDTQKKLIDIINDF